MKPLELKVYVDEEELKRILNGEEIEVGVLDVAGMIDLKVTVSRSLADEKTGEASK
jgi:hypothetical protein